MEQVKIFYGWTSKEGGTEKLESKVNTWLEEAGEKIEITRVIQNASGSVEQSVIISIFHKTKK